MDAQATGNWRELDSRMNDGIEVGLWWHSATGRLVVTVEDHRSGESFELDVRPGETALDVYRHPYPCAEARGVLRALAGSGA